jgi:hypothetical protein
MSSSINKALAALDRALEERLNIISMAALDADCFDPEDPYDWPDPPGTEKEVEEEDYFETDSFLVVKPAKEPTNLYSGCISEKELMSRFPVTFSLPNKALVAQTAYPISQTEFLDSDIRISRWRSNESNIPNAGKFPDNPSLNVVDSFFEYSSVTGASSWYPNFAHQCLFTAWDSYLLAQDELQVLEFPCLAALHSFLPRHGSLTVDHEGPSPILIQGAIRRCSIDTNTSPSIYGNAFSRASPATVKERLSVLDPPLTSNIYAMEAPTRGWKEYTRSQIVSILSTAYTAFSQIVVVESASKQKNQQLPPGTAAVEHVVPIELHIGYWGCGAYGGNSVLMVLIQLLAAKLARIEFVIVHGSPDVSHARRAVELFENELPLGSTEAAVAWLTMQKFQWGVSDGN